MTRKLIAEFLGTLTLVLVGGGAAIQLGTATISGQLAIALAFGLAVIAGAYVFGGVSGGHFNPAVSLGMLLSGRITLVDFVGYLVAQFAGATAAAGLLKWLVLAGVTDQTGALASNSTANIGVVGSLIAETILTFIFVLTILGVTADASKGASAGLVIGLTLTGLIIVGIPLTGASLNPARSFGPALLAGGASLSSVWVFIVAPLLGAALAAGVFRLLVPTSTATPTAATSDPQIPEASPTLNRATTQNLPTEAKTDQAARSVSPHA